MPKLTDTSAGLTGSVIAAALGESPWATANDILKRSYEATLGIEPPPFDNQELMDFGNDVEPLIANRCNRALDLRGVIYPGPLALGIEGIPLQCSTDQIGLGTQVIKTDPARNIEVIGGGEIDTTDNLGVQEFKWTTQRYPRYSIPPLWQGPGQIFGAMLCQPVDLPEEAPIWAKGLTWGSVSICFAGAETRHYVYRRDDELLERIEAAAYDFRARLDELLVSDGADGWYPFQTSADGNTVFPTVDDDENDIELNGLDDGNGRPIADYVADFINGHRIKKSGEEVIDKCEAQIKEALGNHKRGVVRFEEELQTVKGESSNTFMVSWPVRNYGATEARTVPAKEARTVRLKTLSVQPLL